MLILSLAYPSCIVSAANGTTTRIGHACNDEHGRLTGGSAGDQTGKEVAISKWNYGSGAYGWTFVARVKDVDVARSIANNMKAACDNNNIGYDKNSRRTLYYAAKDNNWNIAGITKKVECDCISLVSTVCTASGVPISVNAGSRDLKQYLIDSKCFTIFTGDKYTQSDKYLQPGDILCTEGKHACIVVESDNPISRKVIDSNYVIGKKYKLLCDLKVRKGPGTGYSATKTLKKGNIVKCIRTRGNWIKYSKGWICGKQGDKKYVKIYKASNTLVIKVGKNYKLAKALYVRKGPGTSYAIKKRSSLTADARKHAITGTTKAMLKKGTIVTCLEKKGDWMRIPSGWICCKKGNITKA